MSELQIAAGDDSKVAVTARGNGRFLEIVVTASVIVLLVILALTLVPTRTGDGFYYFAMLDGLANDGSPAMTDRVRDIVVGRFGFDPQTGMVIRGRNGNLYAWHFFAYPFLCVPAYKLLQALNLDVLQAFQLTNALLIGLALTYVLVISRLAAPSRWFIAAGFLLSTATIYFQWTHPEVFTAALVLMASVGLVTRQYVFAALLAAVGSLQNPSAALLIMPIFGAQMWELRVEQRLGWLTRDMLWPLGATLLVSMVGLASYGWSYYQFGVLNPIASKGSIDYSSVNLGRLNSFVFDLNQGLIVGLPLLLWAVPAVLAFRAISVFSRTHPIARREDFLLAGFLLMAIPTLGQTNWNAGHSVFLRYAAWAGMAPMVWVAVTLGGIGSAWRTVCIIPAVALQLGMALYIGGLSVSRFPYYAGFMPWVEPIWNHIPHFYNPDPEIFFERLVGRESAIKTPAVLKGRDGQMIRVLTQKRLLKEVAEEVCGSGSDFVQFDDRPSSQPKMIETEGGYSYVVGRFDCEVMRPVTILLPATISFAAGSTVAPKMSAGWSSTEAWGTWTNGDRATLRFYVEPQGARKISLKIVGQAFVSQRYSQQRIELVIANRVADSWVTKYPDAGIERVVLIDSDELIDSNKLSMEFRLPDAVSPAKLGLSGDARRLGLGLKEIRIERVATE